MHIVQVGASHYREWMTRGVGNISQRDVECRARTMPGTCGLSDGTVMTTGVTANPTCTVVVLAPRQAENIHERLEGGAR